MKNTLRLLLGLTLVSVIGAMAIATVGMAWLRSEMPGVEIGFNGAQVVAGDLDARHWAIAVLALAAALIVTLTVVPLVLAFGFVVGGAALGVALLAVVASLVWVTAPLWLAVALVWWLLRARRTDRSAAA
ncbi:MAG TPA: hypothetical protein VFQ20_11935 [Burkholderiaceae bacterium]|nr:hypothetical protein [Burkholderiaceae bacterium]